MSKSKHFVEVRILNPADRTASIQSHFQSWFRADGLDLVFRSPLTAECSASDHLKWLHSMLERHRKFIRQLEGFGVQTVVRIYVKDCSLVIEPEALLLGHQLHLRTEITMLP